MSEQQTTDMGLVRLVIAGDERAFEQFFTTYFPRLYRFALARTAGDHMSAEDVAQITLCKVMRKLHTYRGEAALFTWLCQICRNELASRYRKATNDPLRHQPIEDSPAVRAALETLGLGVAAPEVSQQHADTKRQVQVVMDYLPPKYAMALDMKYLQGERVDTIAKHLDISEKAAESLLTRARNAFRDGFQSIWSAAAERP